jgi:hypothetical protein
MEPIGKGSPIRVAHSVQPGGVEDRRAQGNNKSGLPSDQKLLQLLFFVIPATLATHQKDILNPIQRWYK